MALYRPQNIQQTFAANIGAFGIVLRRHATQKARGNRDELRLFSMCRAFVGPGRHFQ